MEMTTIAYLGPPGTFSEEAAVAYGGYTLSYTTLFRSIGRASCKERVYVFGALIMFFLIVEPHGLARLWQIGKGKLRLWPFPH